MMRTIVCSLAAVLVVVAASAQQPAPAASQKPQPSAAAQKTPEGPQPVIDIAAKIKDFGTVAKGEKIHATFEKRRGLLGEQVARLGWCD